MDADNSFYVKFIATEAPTFFWYIISVLAMVSKAFQQRKERKESDYALWLELLEFVQKLRGLLHLEYISEIGFKLPIKVIYSLEKWI